jgi:hypothetical protein
VPTIRITLPAGSQTINLLTPLPAISGPVILSLDSTQRVVIATPSAGSWTNNSFFTVTGAGSLTVKGAVDGTGSLTISAGGNLTANHVVQNSLIIGGAAGNNATLTIAASDASGKPLAATSAAGVPSATVSSASAPPIGAKPSAPTETTTTIGAVAPSSLSVIAVDTSGSADSASAQFEVVSLVQTKALSHLPHAGLDGEQAPITMHPIGSALDPGAVASVFNELTELEWWSPSRAWQISASHNM